MSFKRKYTDLLVIHCTATPPDRYVTMRDIDSWHRAKGWAGAGYHFLIRRDGIVDPGRHIDRAGAHTRGENGNSIGVALAGGVDHLGVPENNFTDKQWLSLKILVLGLDRIYDFAEIAGHYEFANKACPSFNVDDWLISLAKEGIQL